MRANAHLPSWCMLGDCLNYCQMRQFCNSAKYSNLMLAFPTKRLCSFHWIVFTSLFVYIGPSSYSLSLAFSSFASLRPWRVHLCRPWLSHHDHFHCVGPFSMHLAYQVELYLPARTSLLSFCLIVISMCVASASLLPSRHGDADCELPQVLPS